MSIVSTAYLAVHAEHLIAWGITVDSKLTIEFVPAAIFASEELDPIDVPFSINVIET